MNHLNAEKCNDSWLVEITNNHIVWTESDVYKLIKQNGLVLRNKNYKLDKDGEPTDEVIGIYAD